MTGKHLLLTLIILHQLDGKPIRVEHDAIVILKDSQTGASSQCKHGHGSAIVIGTRGLCVTETPDQICAKVEKFGGQCER